MNCVKFSAFVCKLKLKQISEGGNTLLDNELWQKVCIRYWQTQEIELKFETFMLHVQGHKGGQKEGWQAGHFLFL